MKPEYDFRRAKRGALDPLPPGKTRITIRLDDHVLAWFKAQVHAAGGGNYQTLINIALVEHIQRLREPLEDTLRRVIREELPLGPRAVPEAPNEGSSPVRRAKTDVAGDRDPAGRAPRGSRPNGALQRTRCARR